MQEKFDGKRVLLWKQNGGSSSVSIPTSVAVHPRCSPISGASQLTMEPPGEIDGATVIYWAYSVVPFFVMPDGGAGIPIHGLAVAQYQDGSVYRFSCDRDWESQNDSRWDSVEAALHAPSGDYDTTAVRWISRAH